MNSLTVVIMLIVGGVLLYSAVKGTDPRELLKAALTRNPVQVPAGGKAGSVVTR